MFLFPLPVVQFKCNADFQVLAATNAVQTFVNDHLFKFSLSGCSLHNFLINSVSSHKTIHNNWFGLTNPVTAILSLQVHLWILTNYNKIKKLTLKLALD